MSIPAILRAAAHRPARLAAALLLALAPVCMARAQSPFEHGWVLDPAASDLNVMSVKKGKIAEISSFAAFSGVIGENGKASVKVQMDSIDTKIDLRNVRMRFLFFETFKFPEATVSLELDPAQLADLAEVRRKRMTLPYAIELHGITVAREDDVTVTLLDPDTVAVASLRPIPLSIADFDLTGGLEKLQEAAGVEIVPVGAVTFSFTFRRTETTATAAAAPSASPGSLVAAATTAAPTPERAAGTLPAGAAPAALETRGEFDREACLGRFEILSRTGNIYFGSGSARLAPESDPLLRTLADVVRRCPSMRIEVAGHTDSDGGEAANQALSEARAKAVADYLAAEGVDPARMRAVGYGETRPLLPNDSAAHKARNRRIEFTALGG